jgi:hypothetical protein
LAFAVLAAAATKIAPNRPTAAGAVTKSERPTIPIALPMGEGMGTSASRFRQAEDQRPQQQLEHRAADG